MAHFCSGDSSLCAHIERFQIPFGIYDSICLSELYNLPPHLAPLQGGPFEINPPEKKSNLVPTPDKENARKLTSALIRTQARYTVFCTALPSEQKNLHLRLHRIKQCKCKFEQNQFWNRFGSVSVSLGAVNLARHESLHQQEFIGTQSELKVSASVRFGRNVGPAPLQKCVGNFCCINFGGFCRGFSWRIFLGTFSHKNEEKKSGDKICEKIRRPKNKNPRKIRSAENQP